MTALRQGSTLIELPLDELKPNERLRLIRLARELRLTDQILSLDVDTVSVEVGGPAPAWTTLEGDKVSFSYAKMPKPMTAIDVAVWLGTNAHELGHVLFSPRRDSTLMFRVLESERTFLPGIAQMHNIVEDQRQERLILARFSPWRGYLTAALGHHLVADDDSAWLLMAGRTWLPQTVRDEAKARFVARRGQAECDAVTRIVGDYQRLVDPGDTESDEAWELLQELHRMFEDEHLTTPTTCTVMTGGEPDTSDAGSDAPDTADEAQGEGGEPGDGDGDDADGDSDADADAEGEGDAESSSDKPGAGAGSQPADSKKPRDPVKARKDALKDGAKQQIEADGEAKADLDSILDALDYGRPGEKPEGADREGRYDEASDAAKRLHREVADALLDLKDDSEPGWVKRVDGGRLKPARLLNPNVDADTLFDRYEPGQMDASELEVVLLLDVSGSMGGQQHKLAETTWAIHQSVDDLEGRCTILTFDSGPHRVLAEPDVRPDGRMFVPATGGGTMPDSALAEAFKVTADSAAKNRLMIVLTDGDWYDGRGAGALIRAMNEHGVVTVCALLGNSASEKFHDCQYGARIDNLDELARLFQRIASERIASWL
jgi:hypothetical protein